VAKNLTLLKERLMADGMKMIGHTGESLTVHVLAKMGIYAYSIKHDGTDVIAIGGNGLPLSQRIEVKSSEDMAEPKKNLFSFSCSRGANPKRWYKKEDCDILAFVSLLDESIIFKAVEDIPMVTKKIHRRDFQTEGITNKTWSEALNKSFKSTNSLTENLIKKDENLFDNIENTRHN